MPVYTVIVRAPEIYEEVVVNADTPEQAQARAVGSALARQRNAAVVTVEEQETRRET